jgi:hypothetical protein
MSDPAFTRSDLFSIPAAKQAGLATAARGLLSAGSYPSVVNNPLASLIRDFARTIVEAGFKLHHCHRYDPLRRLRRVGLMPIPTKSGTGRSGIAVSRTTDDLLPDRDWRVTYSRTCQLMNAAPGSGLHMFGDLDRQRGIGGTHIGSSHRGQRTEAGR